MRWKHSGATAVVGIGTTPYFRRGACDESGVRLALRAIVAACDDAGLDPREIDGFVSYGADKNTGGRLMSSLGTRELRYSALVWGGGGSGSAGALSLAVAAVVAGMAEVVVVYRAVSQVTDGRLSQVVKEDHLSPQYEANGLLGPVQYMALRTRRMIEVGGVPASATRAFARAAYFHASHNPGASSRGKLLDDRTYDESPYVAEPNHIYDCSRENDGAAAILVTTAERARQLAQPPAYVLAAPQSTGEGWGELQESRDPYTSGGFASAGARLWREAGAGPSDVDVAQVYENTVGGAVAVLIDLGFCTPESAGEFFTFENLVAPSGSLPIQTAGGNIAEGFFHGMGLALEGVRQIRGSSWNQVPGARLSLVTGGPWGNPASAFLLGTDAP